MAYRLNELLEDSGFEVAVHDVEYSPEEIASKGFTATPGIYDSRAEVIFLVTMHKEYYHLDFEKLAMQGSQVFCRRKE